MQLNKIDRTPFEDIFVTEALGETSPTRFLCLLHVSLVTWFS